MAVRLPSAQPPSPVKLLLVLVWERIRPEYENRRLDTSRARRTGTLVRSLRRTVCLRAVSSRLLVFEGQTAGDGSPPTAGAIQRMPLPNLSWPDRRQRPSLSRVSLTVSRKTVSLASVSRRLRCRMVLEDRSVLPENVPECGGIDALHVALARDRQLCGDTGGLSDDHVLRLHAQR